MDVINQNLDGIFFELVKESRQSIKLCSPFVKDSIIRRISDEKQASSSLSLITNINLNSFFRRSSDIEAIASLLHQKYDVINCQNLHAKMYIFDDEISIITSANLTYSGFNKNFEYGVKISYEPLNRKIVEDYHGLSDRHTGDIVTEDHITSIKKILTRLPEPQEDIDFSNELDEIFQRQENEIVESLSGWMKDVFLVIDKIENNTFSLSQINQYVPYFKKLHPNNHHIEAKIRQQLQYLRNMGLIRFESNQRGIYKKLWK